VEGISEENNKEIKKVTRRGRKKSSFGQEEEQGKHPGKRGE
jgi:hypothetical protein